MDFAVFYSCNIRAKVFGTTWALLSEIDEAEVKKPVNALIMSIILSAIILAAIVVAISFVVISGIWKLIGGEPAVIASIADQVAGGDLTVTMDSGMKQDTGIFKSIKQMVEKLKEVIAELKQSLAEKEVLMREVHHRVKNNLSMVSSMLKLQSGYIEDQALKGIFNDCQKRIHTIAMVHSHLYKSEDLVNIDTKHYVEELLDLLSQSLIDPNMPISIQSEIDPVKLNLNELIPLGMIITEAVTNSLKYAFKDKTEGKVRVTVKTTEGGGIVLCISDNGTGLPEGFDYTQTNTFGFKLIEIFARQLHGKCEIQGEDGTAISISFVRN